MRKRSRKKKQNYNLFIIPAAVLVVVLIFLGQTFANQDNGLDVEFPPRDTTVITPVDRIFHAHVDFKVFLNGEEVDFNKPEYDAVNRFVHIHTVNELGDKLIHMHDRNVPIGLFFDSLGMEFSDLCFVLDTGEEFCNDGENKVRFFVNGEESFDFANYVPNDLDRILITYGSSDEEIQSQIESVTDIACVFSGQCAERAESLGIPEELLNL